MAQKAPGGDGNSKTVLLAGLVCIFLALAWGTWELLRPETDEERKTRIDNEKVEAEKARRNAPRPGG